MTPPITKHIHLKLDAATAAALPSPATVNVSEWIRQAIREKHERERRPMTTSETMAQMRAQPARREARQKEG